MKTFNKSDLRTADVVVNSKGSYGVVLKGTYRGDLIKWFLNDEDEIIHKFRSLSSLNEDLTYKYEAGHRIIKVYRPTDPHDMSTMNAIKDKYLIWEEKIKEVTIEELERQFGCKVKIVGEN